VTALVFPRARPGQCCPARSQYWPTVPPLPDARARCGARPAILGFAIGTQDAVEWWSAWLWSIGAARSVRPPRRPTKQPPLSPCMSAAPSPGFRMRPPMTSPA
jgi:hypothetical protein